LNQNPIVNKEFYCIQYGKEYQTNYIKPVSKKKTDENEPKNGSEKLKKLPYFLNEKNQKIEGVNSLLNEVEENPILRKPKKANIYSLLALNPKRERKKNGQIKPPKRNTAFQNIKKILTKTEDEKHELDIKILQFRKVHDLLGELKDVLEEEEKGEELSMKIIEENEEIEQPDKNEDTNNLQIKENQVTTNKIIIEEETDKAIENNRAKTSQQIFEKYFKSKVEEMTNSKKKKIKSSNSVVRIKDLLLDKIRRMNILNYIYESNKRRKTKIVEIILNNINPRMIQRLQERILENLNKLNKLKNHLIKSNWKNNLINNYYKSLDVKSGSLQQNEKAFLSPKYFISNFIEAENKIMKHEKLMYWSKVYRPEISLSLKSNQEHLKTPLNSEILNNSLVLGAEEGMYDSLIKINSKNQEIEDKSDPLKNKSELALSEHQSVQDLSQESTEHYLRTNLFRHFYLQKSFFIKFINEFIE
jgi:hypothetical protein